MKRMCIYIFGVLLISFMSDACPFGPCNGHDNKLKDLRHNSLQDPPADPPADGASPPPAPSDNTGGDAPAADTTVAPAKNDTNGKGVSSRISQSIALIGTCMAIGLFQMS